MFLKHIALANIRSAATAASAQWRQAKNKCLSGDWDGATGHAQKTQDLLLACDAVALPLLIGAWVAAAAHASCRPLAVAQAARIEDEISALASGDILPSLCLYEPTTALARSAKTRVQELAVYFLPVVPTINTHAHAGDDFGSPAKAAADYGRLLQTRILTIFKNPSTKAFSDVRQVIQAIDNRFLPGSMGLSFSLALAWVDAVALVGLPFDKDDVLLVARLNNWLNQAHRGTPITDNNIVSALAYRVAKLNTQRAMLLARRLGLPEMLAARQSSTYSLPQSAVFDVLWQDAVSAWDGVCAQPSSDPHKLKLANDALLQLVAGTASHPPLSKMAQDGARMLTRLRNHGFEDGPAVRASISTILAAVQDAFKTQDDVAIEEAAGACSRAVERMLASGQIETIETSVALPVDDLFREVSAELASSITALGAQDVPAALIGLNTALLSMSLVQYTTSGQALNRACGQMVERISTVTTVNHCPGLELLKQAVDIMSLDADAALALLADLDEHYQRLTQQVAPNVDRPDDAEIGEIFVIEALEVCAQIQTLAESCLTREDISPADGADLRRHWHTIKGSARMAGLQHLGDIAASFETPLNDHLARGHVPLAWAQASTTAAGMVTTICMELHRLNEATIVPTQFAALLPTPERAPEITVATLFPSLSEVIPAQPSETFEVDQGLPSEPLPLLDDLVQPVAAEESTPDSAVFEAFRIESQQMVATIAAQCESIRVAGVNYELVRAAHSLAGMSRIVEAHDLAVLSLSLEHWATYHFSSKQPLLPESLQAVTAIATEIDAVLSYFLRGIAREAQLTLASDLLAHGSDEAGAESLVLSEPVTVVDVPLAMPLELPPSSVSSEVAPAQAEPALPEPIVVVPVDEPAPQAPTAQEVSTPVVRAVSRQLHGFEINAPIVDDVDQEVLGAYAAEAEETLSALDVQIANFVPGVTSFEAINRLLHTLKGGARLSGMLRLGGMLHKMEDSTMATETLSERDAADLIGRVQRALDQARQMMRYAASPEAERRGPEREAMVQAHDDKAVLRVAPARLEAVSDLLGRIRITQDRVKRRTVAGFGLVDGMKNPMQRMLDLTNRIALEAEARMDAGARQFSGSNQFDALEMDRFTEFQELTRRLMEAAHDVGIIYEDTERVFQDINEAMRQQIELSNSVQSGVDVIGQSNFQAAEKRLRAAVRQASEDCGKSCQLQIDGDIPIERAVMDRLIPAIEHLLRNSIAHGVESASVRRALGKPEQGLINVSSVREGSYAIVTVRDDGAGVDFDRVHAKAVARGLVQAGTSLSDAALTELLFSAGFSTAEAVNDVSGRGVGLDAARSSITRLGGRVTLTSVRGKGVEFHIRVPLSSGYVSGLLVEAAGAPYIVPSAFIKGVEMMTGKAIGQALDSPGATVTTEDGDPKRLFSIAHLCGVQSTPRVSNFQHVIVPHGHPDTLLFGEQPEYINGLPLRHFNADIVSSAGVIGHSVLSDGRIAVVINPDQLLTSMPSLTSITQYSPARAARAQTLVLVVDDSITVRAATKRLLLKHGFRVETAENGSIALERIALELPDVVLMDIEMPVMDGFEATRAIKANAASAHVPVAIISSRNAEKHRTHADSVGAGAFFGKPYKDTELLEWINAVVAATSLAM